MVLLLRFIVVSLTLGIAACQSAQSVGPIEDAAVRYVYASQQCSVMDPVARWLPDAQAFEAAVAEAEQPRLGSSSSVSHDVDFSKETVLLISMGQLATGGYGLRLAEESLPVVSGVGTLRVEWIEPPPDAFVTQALTSPCLLVALPREGYDVLRVVDQNGQIRFELSRP
ncbi:MAG: protease complex subunit PrcB family protein [Chromatiales bacterium]|jgi:hypothetical protein